MRIKYSPTKDNHDTTIEVADANTVIIDGIEESFDAESITYPDIGKETDYRLIESHRENGELYLTVVRHYKDSCAEWDDSDYHEVTA